MSATGSEQPSRPPPSSSVSPHQVEQNSVACQTDPNLIDKLIDNHVRKQLDDIDLYQEYVRSAQCAQFWPLDKNPIRSLVPSMLKVDLPEHHLKNESLMFDLAQAITNNSKLVNLLAKYIHHIVPNVIISKRIDLIPLITCTIRVCRDTNEQERLMSLLFNLIKRPNEEQRRMILSGIIVVLQVSPQQSSSLLLPNLWDHVNDKFPERRILLAESCSTLAHYVRPVMRTNLILSILIQLLKDKNAAVRSAACKSFACLITLIMDRNDEVFDACLSATEDIIQDVLQQTPVNFCEHRYELEQMRICALETVFPLLSMWAVKLNRFRIELAEFYLTKAEKFFTNLLTTSSQQVNFSNSGGNCTAAATAAELTSATSNNQFAAGSFVAAAVAKRRSAFFESRHSSFSSSANSSGFASGSSTSSGSLFSSSSSQSSANLRRQSAFVSSSFSASSSPIVDSAKASSNSAALVSQRAINAYLKMLNYMVPFVFSDAVHSCAWLSKSKLHLPTKGNLIESTIQVDANNNSGGGSGASSDSSLSTTTSSSSSSASSKSPSQTRRGSASGTSGGEEEPSVKSEPLRQTAAAPRAKLLGRGETTTTLVESGDLVQLFDRPLKFANKLLDPTLIVDESAIVAFHDQLEQENATESVEWILNKFLRKFLSITACFSHKTFHSTIGGTSEVIQELLFSTISSVRQLCLMFGKHLTRTKLRPLIKQQVLQSNSSSLVFVYIGALTAFEPIEQHEFEEIVLSLRQTLSLPNLTRNDVEMLAIAIRIFATSCEQIQSPSTRQKFLTYILDSLVNFSNQIIKTSSFPSTAPATQTTANSSMETASLSRCSPKTSNAVLAATRASASNSSSGGGGKLSAVIKAKNSQSSKSELQQQTQTKEFMLILFRHILTCLTDQSVRPPDWAQILVTKFLPLMILLANDSTDVYICTYARLMCAQLVETFDTYCNCPKITKQTVESIMPALGSLRVLTEQIKASNLKRQIECLSNNLTEKFFKGSDESSTSSP